MFKLNTVKVCVLFNTFLERQDCVTVLEVVNSVTLNKHILASCEATVKLTVAVSSLVTKLEVTSIVLGILLSTNAETAAQDGTLSVLEVIVYIDFLCMT